MDSGDSDPEMFITQTSPGRKRTFHTFDVLCEDTLSPDEDILALAGYVKEVEEQPCVTCFDCFAVPVSETEVRGKIEDYMCQNQLNTRISGLLRCLRIGENRGI